MPRGGDDGDGRKIFVGGLAFTASDGDIREDFGRYGEIEDVFLPTDRDTGKVRGFGFITYKDPRDAEEAASAMNGREYQGREITCNIARPRDASGKGGGGGGGGGGRYGGGDRYGGGGGDRYGDRDRDYDRRDRRDDYDRRDRDYDRRDRDYDRDRDRDRRDRDYDRRDDRDYDRRSRDRDRDRDRDDRY